MANARAFEASLDGSSTGLVRWNRDRITLIVGALLILGVFGLALALLVAWLLHTTVLGRYIYALGRDEQALLAVGLPTPQIKVLVYTLSGLLAGSGGIILTARLGVAAPTAANGYELDIIAAAVIGGASLFGGEGTVLGAILGAVLMQTLRNGLVQLGTQAYWQVGAIGIMTLIVLLLDYTRRRR